MKKISLVMVILVVVSCAMAQWYPQFSGTANDLNSVVFTDTNKGFVVGDSGTILTTSNGGNTWTAQNACTNANLLNVFFPDALHGYITGTGGTILRTTNGGLSWENRSVGLPVNINSVCFIDANKGFAITSGEYIHPHSALYILKTTDGGFQWDINYTYNFLGGAGLNSVVFTDELKGFAIGTSMSNTGHPSGLFFETTDGGNSWTRRQIDYRGFLNSIFFADINIGYLAGGSWVSNNPLLKTLNGGTDWTTLTTEGIYYLKSVHFTDPDTGYAVGKNDEGPAKGIIIKTVDGGTTWVSQATGVTDELNSVFFINSNTGIVAGHNGIILRTGNGGINVGSERDRLAKQLLISPNPTSGLITLSLPAVLPQAILTIYSLSGKEILRQAVTKPTSQLDLSRFPAGMYFVKVSNGNEIRVEKLIKK